MENPKRTPAENRRRERASARGKLRRLLAAYRHGHDLRYYPSLASWTKDVEGPEVRMVIFCGKRAEESARIATEIINSHGFRRLLHMHNASYGYISAKGRVTIEIVMRAEGCDSA